MQLSGKMVNAFKIVTPGKKNLRVSGDFAQNRGLWVKIPDIKSRLSSGIAYAVKNVVI